jgi:hypothetical protein
VQALPFFGLSELSMLVILLAGSGALPLGVPPEKENPVMSHVAPEECVLYATWSGMAQPDPASPNHTEQLLAEAEVRQFAAAIEQTIGNALTQAARQQRDNPQAALLAQSGPLWIRSLVTRPAAIYLTRLEPGEKSIEIEGALIVQADDAAARLDQVLTALLSSEDEQPVEVTIGARKFHRLKATEQLPIELTWGAGNGYLMIGVGEGEIESLSARIKAQQEPAWLTDLKKTADIERRSSLSYVNVRKLLDSLAPLGGPQAEAALASLGLKQLTTFSSVTGLDDSGVVSRSLLGIEGNPRGLLSVLDSEGIVASDLAHIPDDAMIASCFSLEVRKLLEAMVEAAAEVDPRAAGEIEEGLARFEQETGVNLRETVAALGNNWSLHAASADGGLMGSALTVEVWDRARLARAQDELVIRLREGGPRSPFILSSSTFAGEVIYHASAAREPLPFAPAWCLTKSRLIFGLSPQAVKAVLARTSDDKSIADVPSLAPLLAEGKPPLAVSYYDTRPLFESTYASLQMIAPMLIGQMRREGVPLAFDATSLPTARSIGRHLQPSVSVVRRTERGVEFESRQTLPATNLGASLPVGVALLLPAVQSARAAAAQSQASNNLKQQLLALHNFHDTYNRFPAAYSVDEDGKPLLSWRVHILPFIEQQELYKQFHLDEPWDSEHNKTLIAKMPKTFAAPGSKAGVGKTNYLAVGGKHGVLIPPTGRGARSPSDGTGFAAILDGTSNTIALVEATDELAVEWTKPVEWVPSDKEPMKGLVGLRPRGFLVGLCDGSVRMLPETVSADDLRSFFTRDDGRAVNWPADPRR